jgi:hypothetical protein
MAHGLHFDARHMCRSIITVAAATALGIVCLTIGSAHADRRPMMANDLEIECFRDKHGDVWRVQCNPASKVCLYAADDELDSEGARTKPLERARLCPVFSKQPFDRQKREAEGYVFIQGRPDAPHGWTRDDRGRVFQINFNLRRRLYIGGSYAPSSISTDATASRRSAADFGLLVFEHYGGARHPNRHRFRLVEGEIFVDPFSAEVVLAHYDLSRRYVEPLLRVTTFMATPRRYDLRLNIGLWTEVGHLEVHHTSASDSNLWRFATAHATLDLWQSRQLDSFARIRMGIGVERLFSDERSSRTAITAGSAFELDWVLDRRGFHNLTAEVAYEVPRYFVALPGVGKQALRMLARLRYETILIAINDQPLSLRLDAGSERRNDVPGLPDDWALVANAGLRFSLWAPPRPPG